MTENAIRYNRPDGTVRVSVSQDGDDLVVRVADTGCGIPEKYKESIFSRSSVWINPVAEKMAVWVLELFFGLGNC